jgi:hypothetical protein
MDAPTPVKNIGFIIDANGLCTIAAQLVNNHDYQWTIPSESAELAAYLWQNGWKAILHTDNPKQPAIFFAAKAQ